MYGVVPGSIPGLAFSFSSYSWRRGSDVACSIRRAYKIIHSGRGRVELTTCERRLPKLNAAWEKLPQEKSVRGARRGKSTFNFRRVTSPFP